MPDILTPEQEAQGLADCRRIESEAQNGHIDPANVSIVFALFPALLATIAALRADRDAALARVRRLEEICSRAESCLVCAAIRCTDADHLFEVCENSLRIVQESKAALTPPAPGALT